MLCLWSSPPGFNCLTSVAPASGLAVEYSSCFISVMNLDLCVHCFDSLMNRSLSCGRNNLYVYMNHGRGWVVQLWITVYAPCDLLLAVPGRCFSCGVFWLSMFVRFLLVFGLLFVNLVAICCERAVPLAFHSCCFNFSAVLVLVRVLVARPEACPLDMQAVPGSIPTSGTFFRRDLVMKKIPLPMFQEEQLSVTGERMCTKYW